MATIKDVAKLANVSVATVSRVVNNSNNVTENTRNAVLQAMSQLHYQPDANARALSQQTTETIGIVVADVSDPFFGAMIKAVEQIAYQTGNFLLIGNGYHDEQKERKAIEQLIRHRCAALVVHAKMLSDSELSGFMQQVPGMVLINRTLPGFESRCIALDDHYGGYLATRHLLQQHHRHIGFICSDHKISDAIERLQGYKDALSEYHLLFDERNLAYGAPDEIGGKRAMLRLLEHNRRLSAVVCYNDPQAAGAMSILYDNDIQVPQDISLVGFDDVLIARYLRPKLTTIHYPIAAMAQQAACLALALSDSLPLPNVTNLLMPTLIKRHSVQPLFNTLPLEAT